VRFGPNDKKDFTVNKFDEIINFYKDKKVRFEEMKKSGEDAY